MRARAGLVRQPAIIARVTPLFPLAAGFVLLGAAGLLLRSYGPRYRVARLLASVRPTPLAEAIEIAATARMRRYLRVDGRIDSEDAFEDAARRPLVFRRTRLQARSGGRWLTLEDGREQVAFEIGDGLRSIDIDASALDDGLVVILRESSGTVADLADRGPADLDPATPARAIVEQISAVEHAIVLGVAELAPSGRPRLTRGAGRPLILTTLEIPEAMRLLAGGDRLRLSLVAACLLGGALMVLAAAAWALLDTLGRST